MINLVKQKNLNAGILQTDFDIYKNIVNTMSSDSIKSEMLNELEDNIIPKYFDNKLTIVVQTNGTLIGYAILKTIQDARLSQIVIEKIFILNTFLNKNFDYLLIELSLYTTHLLGMQSAGIILDFYSNDTFELCKKMGFYEQGSNDKEVMLNINVLRYVQAHNLLEKFDSKPKDYVDYNSLVISKKIFSSNNSNIYLTSDNRILKMFKSNSFIYIKNMEDTLKDLKKLKLKEILTPKNLVYYNDLFVGYIMDYLPDGKNIWNAKEKYDLEDKIDKIKEIENLIKKLHENNVYISTMDLENIFITSKGDMKVIDCDSFVTKKNIVNDNVINKYKDPYNKIVSKDTDLYVFGIMALELLINKKLDNNLTSFEVEKVYNSEKRKIPASFRDFFESLFKEKSRNYLSESYEKYVNTIYFAEDKTKEIVSEKSGNVKVVVLAFFMLIIAVIGLIVFKYLR